MKSLTIAGKDLNQAFRSAFALVFMFAVPLLVTAMFALMFGSQPGEPEAAFELPATRLVIANLDQGDKNLTGKLTVGEAGQAADSLGGVLAAVLQGSELEPWISVDLTGSAIEARERVDRRDADAALVIPPDFSTRYVSGLPAEATFYAGTTQPVGASLVRAVIEQTLDRFAGTRIAVDSTPGLDAQQAAGLYAQYSAQMVSPSALMEIRAPEQAGANDDASSPLSQVIAPIMGGMMIFFAFFTGGNTAQSILQEAEQGTLARLFTTPTRPGVILNGKFLAVLLTVLVQVTLLLVIARLVFGIHWGDLAVVAMAAAGIITCAAAFGIFLTSLLKSTRQGGAVYGGLLTITGMLGMMPIFTGGSEAVEKVALLVPQGWAVRSLTMAMQGASLSEAALNLLVLLSMSVLFLAVGVWKFNRRFAG